jgi:hypothetical protein
MLLGYEQGNRKASRSGIRSRPDSDRLIVYIVVHVGVFLHYCYTLYLLTLQNRTTYKYVAQ